MWDDETPLSPILLPTQRVVSQYETHEHVLYSKAREAENVRRKQVQLVEKLQEDLEHLKQRNAIKLKVSVYRCSC